MRIIFFTISAVLLGSLASGKVLGNVHQISSVTLKIPSEMEDGSVAAHVVEIKPISMEASPDQKVNKIPSVTVPADESEIVGHMAPATSMDTVPSLYSNIVKNLITIVPFEPMEEDLIVTTSMPSTTEEADVTATTDIMEGTTVMPNAVIELKPSPKDSADFNRCDKECTKFDFSPICATNGFCHHQFPNKCVLDTFLCLNPHLGFKATKTESCDMHYMQHCSEEDLKG